MDAKQTLRNKFEHLRRKPGPKGWQARAATALGYTPGYVSKLVRGKVESPMAEARLKEWKRLNKIA